MDKLVDIQIEGQTIPCYLALPATGSGPGVIVLHAWWGLNDFFKELCERLAEAGFVAIAPDLYGGTTASTIAEAEVLSAGLDETQTHAKILGVLAYLHGHAATQGAGVGVIGFSMGVWFAMHLSRLKPEEVAAVVIFYGSAEADFSATQAAYLGHFAEVDEWEPTEGVRQLEASLRAAGREVTFHTYPGTGHWFFESNRPDAYKAEAARLAWERTLTFLKSRLFI